MDEQNPPIQTRKIVHLNTDDCEWLDRTYGDDVSYSWVFGMLLQQFRSAHTHTPEDYAKLGAEVVVKEIEDKL